MDTKWEEVKEVWESFGSEFKVFLLTDEENVPEEFREDMLFYEMAKEDTTVFDMVCDKMTPTSFEKVFSKEEVSCIKPPVFMPAFAVFFILLSIFFLTSCRDPQNDNCPRESDQATVDDTEGPKEDLLTADPYPERVLPDDLIFHSKCSPEQVLPYISNNRDGYVKALYPHQYGLKGSLCPDLDDMGWHYHDAGNIFPNFTLKDQGGFAVSMNYYHENYKSYDFIMVDMSAPWCGPCNSAASEEKLVLEEFLSRGYKVYWLTYLFDAETEYDALSWKTQYDLEGDVLWDIPADLSLGMMADVWPDYGFRGFPSFFLVEPKSMQVIVEGVGYGRGFSKEFVDDFLVKYQTYLDKTP